jgi:putative ABC transport system permease protein
MEKQCLRKACQNDCSEISTLWENSFFTGYETSPNAWNYTSYIELDPENKDKLQNALNKNQNVHKHGYNAEKIWQYELTALPKVYLHFPAKGEGNLTTTVSLLAIGILLLIVSYINFLNFYIAMTPTRIKWFNIRWIFGESAVSLKLSIMMEALFLSLIAFLASILFINLIKAGVVDFFTADISISQNLRLLFFVGIFSILSGFVAGIYPAIYSTSFKPAIALSGSFAVSQRSKWLKNILIGAQFVTAIFLVIVTIFVKTQHDYMRNKNWGITTENILYFSTERIRDNVDNMTDKLKNNPDITDITFGLHFPGQDGLTQSWGREFEGVRIDVNAWYVKSNFLDFFGITVAEGRGFDELEEDKMILNKAFCREYGFSDIIGKELSNYEIVGIAEDFNFKPLREEIKPIALISSSDANYHNWAFVKTTGMNTLKTIDYIHDTWKIMGVYGLILFNVKSKRKTIALHKINGASVMDVILMLNRSFIVQFVIAHIVAAPIAYGLKILHIKYLYICGYSSPAVYLCLSLRH